MKRLLLPLFLLSITGYMPAMGSYSPLLQVYGIEAADHTGSEEAYLKDIKYYPSSTFEIIDSPCFLIENFGDLYDDFKLFSIFQFPDSTYFLSL